MRYTPEQYALLKTFEYGRLVQELSDTELYTYQFLMQEKLLQPRADIEDGWHILSEQGKRVLSERAERINKASKKKKADIQAQIVEKGFQVFLLALSYILGLFTQEIKAFIVNIFSRP